MLICIRNSYCIWESCNRCVSVCVCSHVRPLSYLQSLSVTGDSVAGSPRSLLAGFLKEPRVLGRSHTHTFSSCEVSGRRVTTASAFPVVYCLLLLVTYIEEKIKWSVECVCISSRNGKEMYFKQESVLLNPCLELKCEGHGILQTKSKNKLNWPNFKQNPTETEFILSSFWQFDTAQFGK